MLDLSDAVKTPPDGFAAVAGRLRVAGQIAKRLDQNEGDILGLFPDLNTLAYEGYQAVKAVRNAVRPEDPFGVFDEPEVSESSAVVEVIVISPTREEICAKIQSTRGQLQHPDPTHNPDRIAGVGYNDYATIVRMLDKYGIEAPALPDHRFHPLQTVNCILRSLDDVELALNRNATGIEQRASDSAAETPSHVGATLDAAGESAGTNDKTKAKQGDRKKANDETANNYMDSVEPQPFSGGTMKFYSDKVELCGVDICSRRRSKTRRRILELLCRMREDGTFEAYSGDEIAVKLNCRGGKGTVSGSIRDLRRGIAESLRIQRNLICGLGDVILSGGRGYRFAECVTVHRDGDLDSDAIRDIRDTVRVPNVPNQLNTNVPNVSDEQALTRQSWILKRLADGIKLKRLDVARHFSCSPRTAQRDLSSLKDAGKIDFVGATRTGYYRLCTPMDGGS
ncbi:MAG: helix-turn-helix transcriptional regulator [Pirellulales bacterium]